MRPPTITTATTVDSVTPSSVETLLEHGFPVFSLNPKQLDRFRDRHSVAGAKDDRLDAFALADALRTDRHKFKRLSSPDETTLALREVSRCYDTLKVDLNRLANRLREQLQRVLPAVVRAVPCRQRALALGSYSRWPPIQHRRRGCRSGE